MHHALQSCLKKMKFKKIYFFYVYLVLEKFILQFNYTYTKIRYYKFKTYFEKIN